MMAKESSASLRQADGLNGLGRAVAAIAPRGPAPVHLWDPPFCGDLDLRIARDGTWFHAGSPIGRPALVRLFASILRRDPEGIMLVTPVEKVRIAVEDAPFVAVELVADPGPSPALRFRTNLDEWVTVDAEHPLAFRPGAAGGLKPYVTVRAGLEALVKRAVFLELVEHGEVRGQGHGAMFGLASAGLFFPMAPAALLEDLA